MRRPKFRLGLTAAALILASTAATTMSSAEAAGSQTVWFDGSYTAISTAYIQPGMPPVSPAALASSRVIWNLDVTAKPSSMPLLFAICMWQHSPGTTNYRFETCSAEQALPVSTTGRYQADLGVVSTWWKIAAGYNLNKAPDVVRFMIKDASRTPYKLLMTKSCGSYCYQGGDIASHLPISIRSSAVLVSGGSTPPPTTTPPTTTPPTTTPPTTTPPTTTPPTTTPPTTTPPTGGRDVVVIAGATNTIGDRPIVDRLRGNGWNVTVVDDDLLTSSKLTGAELVVITSSVVPTKVPTWLATHPAPILSSESYSFTRLRMATSGRDSTASSVDITTAATPVKGALSGRTVVSSSTSLGSATPVSSAVVVATIAGQPTNAAVFTIESGRALTAGTAPDRRVGFFFGYNAPRTATANAWTLFDNAVNWASA